MKSILFLVVHSICKTIPFILVLIPAGFFFLKFKNVEFNTIISKSMNAFAYFLYICVATTSVTKQIVNDIHRQMIQFIAHEVVAIEISTILNEMKIENLII